MHAIHQILAGFSDNDAISNEALFLRDLFRSWGCHSEIYCAPRHTDPRRRRQIRDIEAFPEDPETVAFLHLSIGTPTNRRFAALRNPKVILYHNITPPEFFTGINPALRKDLAEGRRQLRELAGTADVNLAVSAFNAGELEAMGYANVKVFPLAMDFDRVTGAIDPNIGRRFKDEIFTVLFVGRCAPNKKLEKILNVMHHLQHGPLPQSRFLHVGSHAGTEIYYTLLLAHAHDLRLQNTHFLGSIDQPSLNACYRRADVFLCMSEHEGFCAPLLEAMAHDVPVAALARAAVPETLGHSGILFREDDPVTIAETLFELARRPDLQHAVIARQRQRLDTFRKRDLSAELRTLLAPLEAPPRGTRGGV